MALAVRLFHSSSARPSRTAAARAARSTLEPLESRLLMYSDSPCGNWQQPSIPDF